MHLKILLLHSDVVPVKGGYFPSASNGTGIFQGDLLCNGTEDNLLNCTVYESGTHDCPADHSEDAGIICNGRFICIFFCIRCICAVNII